MNEACIYILRRQVEELRSLAEQLNDNVLFDAVQKLEEVLIRIEIVLSNGVDYAQNKI